MQLRTTNVPVNAAGSRLMPPAAVVDALEHPTTVQFSTVVDAQPPPPRLMPPARLVLEQLATRQLRTVVLFPLARMAPPYSELSSEQSRNVQPSTSAPAVASRTPPPRPPPQRSTNVQPRTTAELPSADAASE